MKTLLFTALSLGLALSLRAADDTWDITKIDTSKLPPASDQANLTFATDIKPIFQTSCLRCHGQERQRGGLRLDSLQNALSGGDDGKMILPGDSKSSLLIAAIAQLNDDIAMPPKHRSSDHHAPPSNQEPGGPPPGNHPPQKPLTPAQISLVRAWIDQGAK